MNKIEDMHTPKPLEGEEETLVNRIRTLGDEPSN